MRKVGGVNCQPFLKRSNNWKRAQKFFSREECAQFTKAAVTSTAKETIRSTERSSIQVLAVS